VKINDFLKDHPDEVFYSLAFACNSRIGEINLSMNTEKAFFTTPGEHRTPEEIYSLRYSVEDWKYACFDSEKISEELLYEISQNLSEKEWRLFCNKLLLLFTEILIDFSKTECFKRIPVTDNFKLICIDHDEELYKSELRMHNLLESEDSDSRPLLADVFAGKKFGFGMGVILSILGVLLSGFNYYTIHYHGYYGLKIMALNFILLLLGPSLILFPGADIKKELGGNNDLTMILWWKESTKGHHIFWITMAALGFISSCLLKYVL
jgi:hypothetical protein